MSEAPHLRPFFPAASDFAAAAAPHFAVLVDELGFAAPRPNGEPSNAFDLRYDGERVVVLLSWESDGGFFACQIIPLTASGRLEPDYERWLSPIEVLAARGAFDEWPTQADFDDVDERGFGALMDRAAECLRRHCADVLKGNWSVYDAAHRRLEKRSAT